MTLVLAAGAWHAAGQTAIDLSRQGKLGTGTTLPVRCTVGQVFFMTNVSAGANLYACTAPNVWSVMGLPVLSGDASGTQQSMTVTGIQGRGVSTAGPADQNVLRWNATDGQWEPGFVPATGTALPPGTCAAGSLYLLNNTTNHIQQLYVCSNTNTWTMASVGSGLAANRPVNCVAGQTWLSTDTAAMTYCSVTGNPGTWSAVVGSQGPAGPAGAQGPAGANGNTIWNGAGVPSASAGANGDFYLNTAANCLYGPKASGAWPPGCTSLVGGSPNFSMSSGNTIFAATSLPAGLAQTFVEPMVNPGGGNLQAGWSNGVWQSGLENPANYGNLALFRSDYYNLNGRNATDNSDKKTISAFGVQYAWVDGGGQASGNDLTFTRNGPGDAVGYDLTLYCYNFITAGGDEGCEAAHYDVYGPQSLYVTTVSGTPAVTSGSTALTTAITKNQNGPTTFSVASTSGFNVNDWVTVCASPCTFLGTDTNADTVQITAVGSGTLTAWLMANHPSTDVVTPAPRVPMAWLNAQRLGQWQVWVDHTAPAYAAGTATFVNGSTAVTLSGGSFTTATTTVGGNANAPGCIRNPADDTTHSPWGSGSSALQHWYPLQSGSGTTATLSWPWRGPSASSVSYVIARCDVAGALEPSYSSASESVASVVMRNNLTWTSGDSVEQTVTPNGTVERGVTSLFSWFDSQIGGAPYGLFVAENQGYATAQAAFRVAAFGYVLPEYSYVLSSSATSQSGAIMMGGEDLSGTLLATAVYSVGGVRDMKAITWQPSTGVSATMPQIFPDLENGGLDVAVNSSTNAFFKLTQNTDANAAGVTFDFSGILAAGGRQTITIPNTSGAMVIPTGEQNASWSLAGAVGSTTALGSVTIPSGDGTFSIQICGYNNCKMYEIPYGYGTPPDNSSWRIAEPVSLGTGQTIDDYELDVQGSSPIYLRLRKTLGTDAIGGHVTIQEFGSAATWTPASTTGSDTSTLYVFPATVITQKNNKVSVTNATGYQATIDPTNINANQSIALPAASGTMVLSSTTPSATTIACWKADGKTLGYATMSGGNISTCN